MIARWKERTGRSPPDCLYSKTCRRARPPHPPLAARNVESSPASFPHAATGNVSINLSRSQDPFAPFRRVPRSNLAFPPPLHPLPCPSFELFFCHFFFRRPSPLWYSPPLHVRGKNGFKRSISDSLPACFSKPPRSGARPPSCFGSEKREGETETEMLAVDRSGPDSDGHGARGEKMGGGREGFCICPSLLTSKRIREEKEGEGELLIFHANRPLVGKPTSFPHCLGGAEDGVKFHHHVASCTWNI